MPAERALGHEVAAGPRRPPARVLGAGGGGGEGGEGHRQEQGGQELQCRHGDQGRDININKLYKVTENVVKVLCVICNQEEHE